MERFPDHIDAPTSGSITSRTPSPLRSPPGQALANGHAPSPLQPADRWRPLPTRHGHLWSSQRPAGSGGHRRQTSITDAVRNFRSRRGSVRENAHDLADALKAPVSPKLIALCVLWYTSSALTNTSSKSILTAFDMPATLTLVQFAFVSSLCIFSAWMASVFPSLRTKIAALKHPIRAPTREVIMTTLPLAAFQIGGHLLSSTATARIPVSLVHTIKGLSPLFTVLAYRLWFDIRYPKATYLSLIPLTMGVMLACSGKSGYQGQLIGIVEALLATLIFVTQNIFSKTLFNEAAKAEAEGGHASKKLDKLNLLCYSSGMAFLLTLPIWFWTEGLSLLGDFLYDGSIDLTQSPNAMDHGRLTLEFIFNGIFHFGQNILAFVLLSMVSPVTYSVASLIKRVWVIVVAIIWFRSPTTWMQGVGIGLTFLGLYCYDRTSESNKADRKANSMMENKAAPLLPLNTSQASPGAYQSSPQAMTPHPYTEGYASSPVLGEDSKKTDEKSWGSSPKPGSSGWLPPGTKQEETWQPRDRAVGVA